MLKKRKNRSIVQTFRNYDSRNHSSPKDFRQTFYPPSWQFHLDFSFNDGMKIAFKVISVFHLTMWF